MDILQRELILVHGNVVCAGSIYIKKVFVSVSCVSNIDPFEKIYKHISLHSYSREHFMI